MAWITLTKDDLLGSLNGAEGPAYNAAVTGGIDPAEEIIADVIHEARGHIEDHPGNALAAGLTIPERIKHHLFAIMRFRILTRLDIEVSKARTKEYDDARRFLERVSEGKVSIEKPEGEVDQSGSQSGSMEVVDFGPETLDRAGLDAL